MDSTSVIQLIVLILLLILSAFFSSAETAFSTVNRVRIRTLVEEKNAKAIVAQKVLDSYNKMLSAILIGNNIVNISASALATSLTIHLWGNYAVGIVTGCLTLFVLVFGEITPKTWAIYNSEEIALAYARIILGIMIVLTPIIYVVDKLAGGVMYLLRIDTAKDIYSMTERDLRAYVDVSTEGGVIEQEEKEMIINVFEFGDSIAKDIMIPRIDITMIDKTASYHQLLEVFKESMYTRIPVYEEENDNVIGIVNIKDFLFVSNKREFKIDDILREAYYTYELKKTADLMMEMRKTSMNVSFVLNEYGACVGMITLEDLLEEIVGEIRDEYDEDEEKLIQEVEPFVYQISGGMKLDDINDALNISLDSEDYDSVGGILMEGLDHLPAVGEEIVTPEGYRIRAEVVKNNRIERVLLTLPKQEEKEADGELESLESSEMENV